MSALYCKAMLGRRSQTGAQAHAAAEAGAARAAAVALLARRDFATAELREKLGSKGFDADTVAALIAELSAEGVLNDERHAQNYISWHAGRGQGPIRIAAALRQRGIDTALVQAALAAGPDWHALALKVCRARFGAQPAASWPEKARRARFLQYRGFSADHIRAATSVDSGQD
jgi:regulatory protein